MFLIWSVVVARERGGGRRGMEEGTVTRGKEGYMWAFGRKECRTGTGKRVAESKVREKMSCEG